MLIPLEAINNKWPRDASRVARMVKALKKSTQALPIGVYDKGNGAYLIDPYHAVLLEAYKVIFRDNLQQAIECNVIVTDD